MKKRLAIGVLVAMMLAVSARAAWAGDYNLNPAYCHSHSAWDPLWWVPWQCYLPDPPGGAEG